MVLEAFRTLFNLCWSQEPTFHPLPDHIKRSFISTPGGNIELLTAVPPSNYAFEPRKQPILFVHGGFGHASVWLPWMTKLSQESGYPCYSVSLRGHGGSWQPGYFRMWALTSKHMLAEDVVAAVREVQAREQGREVVLVGHSSGGGLSQLVLSENKVKVAGLVLVASIPCFGAFGVYVNWGKTDPWYLLRAVLHLQHSRSPLSTTTLVHRAFFCPSMPTEGVEEFAGWMSKFESVNWPAGMLRPFINTKNVIQNIFGWGKASDKILVIAGGMDKLMGVKYMREMAVCYRTSQVELAESEKSDIKGEEILEESTEDVVLGDQQNPTSSGNGVRFACVGGAGHHLMNDLQQEVGAEYLKSFLTQL